MLCLLLIIFTKVVKWFERNGLKARIRAGADGALESHMDEDRRPGPGCSKHR